jgi:hypothetical protein
MRFTSSVIAAAIATAAFAVPACAAESQPANAQQMSEIAGDYQLSDGRRIQIDFDGTDVYVQLDKRPRQHMRGTSDGQFSTFDGSITVRHRSRADTPTVDVALRGQSVSVLR